MGFYGRLKKRHADALRPLTLENACIFYITLSDGIDLVDAYSLDTFIASSPRKEVHNLWAFYLHVVAENSPLLLPVGVLVVSQS